MAQDELSPNKRRGVRLRALVLLAVSLLLIACSGGSTEEETVSEPAVDTDAAQSEEASDEPEAPSTAAGDQTIELLDPGAEPWSVLAVDGSSTVSLNVRSTDDEASQVGTELREQERRATFDLEVSVEPEEGGFRVTAAPLVTSIDMPDPPDVSGLTSMVTHYDRHGLQVAPTDPATAEINRATNGLLSTPGLVLTVPEDPVGIGARWRFLANADGSSEAIVEVVDISDDGIEVDMVFESFTDEARFTVASSGTYHRSSLVASSVRTELMMTFDSAANVNGELVQVTDTRRSERVYEQVDQ